MINNNKNINIQQDTQQNTIVNTQPINIKQDTKQEKTNIKNNINIKKFICNKCSLEFNDDMSLRNHQSYNHPVDDYEYTWREAIRNNENIPLAYRDDPYY